MDPSQASSPDSASSQHLMQRAYILMSYGYIEEALHACDAAAHQSLGDGDEITAKSIKGAILSASGRPREAMRELMRLHRNFPDALLPALYLAEACFLAGRPRRAWKILDGIDPQHLADSPWADLEAQLRSAWASLEDLPDLPEPLTVPFPEPSSDQDPTTTSP